MASPAVTVITATYHSARTLKIAISSIIAQTFQNWEAWIVGDGCTDDSAAVVRSFEDPRLNWWNLEHNWGSQAFPNNEGLRRARAPYIAYLGHDDIWLPNHLAVLLPCLQDSGADLVHSIVGIFGPDRLEVCFGPPPEQHGYRGHFVPPSGWLHRRELVEEIGYWGDPSVLDRGADIDFLWRVWRAGKRIHCCEQFTVIKIPSARIGLYALVEEPPQVRYWRRVQSGWPNFQQELLGTAGAELAKCRMGHPPFKAAAARALVIAGHEFRQATEDLPFFFQTWRWFFQRRRRTILAKRGLPRTFLARKAD